MTKTPAAHEIWREVDPRFERFIRIEEVDDRGIHIRTVRKVDEAWTPLPRCRVAIAHPSRFNGKRSGYAFVEQPTHTIGE